MWITPEPISLQNSVMRVYTLSCIEAWAVRGAHPAEMRAGKHQAWGSLLEIEPTDSDETAMPSA